LKDAISLRLARNLAPRLPFYYGWIVVACAMLSNMARQGAAVATLSMFVLPMTLEFGWSRTAISGAVSLGSLLGALSAPFIGPLFDRHGPRALLAASAVVVSACCVALAGTQSLAWFYAAFALSRMTFSTPFDVGTTAAVANWFYRRRAAAMSLLATSIGIALAVIPFATQLVVVAHGWRTAWLLLAAMVLLAGALPQWLLLVRRPEDIGLELDGASRTREGSGRAAAAGGTASGVSGEISEEVSYTRREAMRTPVLWLLMAFTLLVFPVQSGISLHQAPHLMERGLSPALAAATVSAFSVAVALASLLFGAAGHRVSVRGLLACGALLMAAGALTMRAVDGPALAFASAIAFGTGIGGIFAILPVAWANYFGRAHFGAIRGITLPAQVGGQALGPLIAGALHDWRGDYAAGLAVFAVMALCAAGVALLVRPPR
jgi:OFA family oxalate/formate antiporter-like MFS transporter